MLSPAYKRCQPLWTGCPLLLFWQPISWTLLGSPQLFCRVGLSEPEVYRTVKERESEDEDHTRDIQWGVFDTLAISQVFPHVQSM